MDRDTLSGSGIRLYIFLIYVSNLVYHNNSSVNGYKKQVLSNLVQDPQPLNFQHKSKVPRYD